MTLRNTNLTILLIAAVIFGIIAIVFTLDHFANGQTTDTTPIVVANTTQALTTATTAQQVATKTVEPIATEVEAIGDQSALTTTGVITVAAGLISKFIIDRRGNKANEEYVSQADQIIFNNVKDDYNDIATWAEYEIEELLEIYKPENKTKPYIDILNIEINSVTHETIGQRKIKFLQNIVKWNKEIYQTASIDPNIICPDPKNPIARQMTEIKKYSVT